MPIIVDRSNNQIIESSLSYPTDMKGRYELSAPEELGLIEILDGEYIYPRDAGSLINRVEARFTQVYAGYTGTIYNPLLDASDDPSDMSALFPENGGALSPRLIKGDTPNIFGLPALNVSAPNVLDPTGYSEPGLMITEEIDLGALTNNVGSQNVMVWWRAVTKTFTLDKSPIQGLREDVNEPATLIYTEADPALLKVYISADNGGSYSELTSLYPHSFLSPETAVRLAFRNDGSQDVYILAYGIMY